MFLEYFALAMLLLSITAIFYIFIFIHDLPYMIAKKRNHPQAEAIHYACWLSLFTLHAIWPLVFIWAVANKQTMGVSLQGDVAMKEQLAQLQRRLEKLENSPAIGEARP